MVGYSDIPKASSPPQTTASSVVGADTFNAKSHQDSLGGMVGRLHGERLMAYVIQGVLIIVMCVIAFYMGIYVW